MIELRFAGDLGAALVEDSLKLGECFCTGVDKFAFPAREELDAFLDGRFNQLAICPSPLCEGFEVRGREG